MQVNDKNSESKRVDLQSLINSGKELDDQALQRLGESQVNFIIKLFKKIILPKQDFQQYFVNRGISVIKNKNLNFVRNTLFIKDAKEIEKLIPGRIFLKDTIPDEILEEHKYLNLKNHIEKQRKNDPKQYHWIDHFGPNALSKDSVKKIAELNNLFIENENWLDHEEFAAILGKDLTSLDGHQYYLIAQALRLIRGQQDKKMLFQAFSRLGNHFEPALKFYKEKPQLLKAFAENASKETAPDKLAAQLVNFKDWDRLLTKDPSMKELTDAFVSELGKHLIEIPPLKESSEKREITKLFSFYQDAIKSENLKPAIFAKALNEFFQEKGFYEGIKNIGSGYLSVMVRNEAEKKLLKLYVEIAHRETQQPTVVTSKSPIISRLHQDPFSIVETLLPGFLADVAQDPKVKDELKEALKLIAPFANELILSEDVKEYLNKKEKNIEGKANFIKGLLGSTKGTDIITVLALVINIIKANINNPTGFVHEMVKTITDANLNYQKSKNLSNQLTPALQKEFDQLSPMQLRAGVGKEFLTERERYIDSLSPIQKWLLDGLPNLAKKTPFFNTLANVGFSFLDTGVGQWLGGAIGGRAIKTQIIKLIDNSPLSDEQKKYWKENENLMRGVEKLVNVLIPIIPKIKANHDLNFYSAAVRNINELVHQDMPIQPEKVTEELSRVITHFLDEDLMKYRDPLVFTLQEVPSIL